MKILIPEELLPLAEAFEQENTKIYAVGGAVRTGTSTIYRGIKKAYYLGG